MNRQGVRRRQRPGGDTVRDVCIETEAASGSAFDDFLLGTNDIKLSATQKRARQRQSHHRPRRASSILASVSFDGGNIMLGGGGSDLITAAAATTSSTATPACMSG